MKPFEAINAISTLIEIILLSVGGGDAEDIHESCAEHYKSKWQEISRIAAEQAAKPEIQGNAER